jgi:glutaredoxin
MPFHRQGLRARTFFAFLVLVSACRKGTPSPPGAEPPPREARKNSALYFTYLDPGGMFATTDQADKVPEATRRVVRIMARGKGEPARRSDLNVEVIDLRELLAKGRTQPRVMSHEAFETSALAQLPPGDSCPLAGPHGPPLAEEPATPMNGRPIVVLYATKWCKACQAARHYLVSNRIPFVREDIENEPSAARELEQKASRFGISADRVPILDVLGRLLVGYDETRMNGFLADW